MKFAHLGDCHLGGWRFPELQELNMQSFSQALDICIKEKVDAVLIAGDLFDSAYPSIEILKRTFLEFRKLKDAEIPCFLIAGSHDFSVAGKTFLDVLEHAGFCKNVFQFEERNEKIVLQPTVFKDFAIYGFPGKKSGLEIPELRKVAIDDAPGFFKIFMLHTALKEAIGNLPIEAISMSELPKADYYALAHLHIDFNVKNFVYSGPIFPNNFEELEELSHGMFYIIEHNQGINQFVNCRKIPLAIKDTLVLNISIDNSITATEKIISELNKQFIDDKIILLRLSGKLTSGKISDIHFNEIEQFAKDKKAYAFIKNISKLTFEENELYIETKDMHIVEDSIIKDYFEKNPSNFSDKIPLLIKTLGMEKQEDEKNQVFSDRLLSELSSILNFKI
ncbi:MAG TPA: exonuclease SbcCD subunit D [Candidatus Paceibacterota bacterium]|nr:exonuclease SbcCD subunit D [Candidatus Paceibacterota bacterium]